MNYGISQKSFNMIMETLKLYKEIEKVVIFGSRAMGNYKNGSDIDLAVFGKEVTDEIINRLSIRLNEELPIPYYFDILHYETLSNEELKEHIETLGKIFYKRDEIL
jgi:predicted nucleotidyltransferase